MVGHSLAPLYPNPLGSQGKTIQSQVVKILPSPPDHMYNILNITSLQINLDSPDHERFPLFKDAMIVVYLTLLLQFKALLNCMQVFIYSVRAKIECMKKKLSLELDCFSEVVFTQVVELWCEHVLDFFLQPRVGIYEREKRF